ncbi:hypothetical protein GCM10020295_81390 [Streptomyces cinereospinus]
MRSARVTTATRTTGRPGGPEILIGMDSGYDTACLTHALAGLPVVLVGRPRPDRVVLRDAGPARSGPRHGRVRTLARPDTRHAPRPHHHNGHQPLRHRRGEGLGPHAPQTHPPRPRLEHGHDDLPSATAR